MTIGLFVGIINYFLFATLVVIWKDEFALFWVLLFKGEKRIPEVHKWEIRSDE